MWGGRRGALMGRYFTIMVVPERDKGVRSFRVPKILLRAFLFMGVISVFILSILAYDYWEILKQVYENRHLTVENRQLKEQIQLFNMKIHALTNDIERIKTFERKLRVISGIEQSNMTTPLVGPPEQEQEEEEGEATGQGMPPLSDTGSKSIQDLENFKDDAEFLDLQNLYEQKMAMALGPWARHTYTKEWNQLARRSFLLAESYAELDYKFKMIKNQVKGLEVDIHELDQFLLDRDSFLKSTPTLMPTRGWITSYYGPRISPTSKRPKMHEGIDIGARPATPIVAPADGVVTDAGRRLGLGNFIQLNHGYGIETIYAHAKTLSVERGERVSRGDELATVGSTGHSTGPHVHYEVRVNGTPVDPLYFILD